MPKTIYGTHQNDREVIKIAMSFVYYALDGLDTISLGTSKRSAYTITQSNDGAVHVDSVSGASEKLDATLYNVEILTFDSDKDQIDLTTYFKPTTAVTGTAENDVLSLTTLSAKVDGLAGIDTLALSAVASSFNLQTNATGYSLMRKDGTGTVSLTNVERLDFSDQKIALDLTGNAGSVAKILGAVFGAAAVARPDYVGIGLSLLDSGQYDETSLMVYALDVRLGKNASPQAVVDLLYFNLVGQLPDAQTRQSFVDLIAANSTAWLGHMAATHPLNEANIQLTGLQQTGLIYT
jgi:hypothetical protein